MRHHDENAAEPSQTRRLAGNTLASAARGLATNVSTAILTLGLGHFLEPRLFDLWALGWSLASFAMFLELGMPLAVTTASTRAALRRGPRAASEVVDIGLRWIAKVWFGALAIACVLAIFLGRIYRDVQSPHALGVTFLALVVANILTVACNIVWAYFLGLQSIAWKALPVAIAARLGPAFAAIGVAIALRSPVLIALVYVAGQAVALLAMFRSRTHSARVGVESTPEQRVSVRRELTAKTKTLSVWSAGMFLVVGLDGALVGVFDYHREGLYAAAMTLVAAVGGVANAVTGPLVSLYVTSGHNKRSHHPTAASPIVRAGLANGLLIFMVYTGLLTVGAGLLHASLPHGGWHYGVVILGVLGLGMAIRQLGVPAVLAVVAEESDQKGLGGLVVAEALTNLMGSVLLGLRYGAVGVALGTVLGAAVAEVVIMVRLFNRGVLSPVGRRAYAWQSMVKPGVVFVPTAVWLSYVQLLGTERLLTRTVLALSSYTCSIVIAYYTCLPEVDRSRLREAVVKMSTRIFLNGSGHGR